MEEQIKVDKKSSSAKKALFENVSTYLTPVLAFLLIALFYNFNSFYLIENPLLDKMVVEERETHPNIKILAIDEQSLEQIGKWPWSREIMARVSEELTKAGAKAVWLDILYTEKSSNPEEDEAWAKVMENTDNIYHSFYFELADKQVKDLPLQVEKEYLPVIPVEREQLGLINTIPEKDGVIRQAILGIKDMEGNMIPAIDVVLANLLLPEEEQIRWDGSRWLKGQEVLPVNAWNQIYFSYSSTPSTRSFEVLPIAAVIKGELDPSYYEGSLVLIGPFAVGMSDDLFMTPGSKSVRMFGVEIHANIVQSLYDGKLYRMAPQGLGFGILLILTLAAYLLMNRGKARRSVFILLGLMALYLIIHIAVFATTKVLLPLFYPLLTLFIVYVATVVQLYLKERKERNRVIGIFGRYVSKGVVKEILENKDAIQLGGVRRDVTLVFVDIRGFTPLSEKMEPENVILILNEYLDLCTRAVFANDGTLDKYIGDGVMSIFGAPMDQPDHAARAIRAALQMKKESAQLAERLMEKYGVSVRFGIGINSGPAVVGNIGSQERMDYTAIGDTVNLAARLESNAKPGQILISHNTYERVKEQFMVTPLEPIKVKGKEQPVQIYQVEGELANPQHEGNDQEMKNLVHDNG